jgi:hypothetical protein
MKKMFRVMEIIGVACVALAAILLACLGAVGIVFACEALWTGFVAWFYTGINGMYFIMGAFIVALIGGMALNLAPSKR